MPTKPRSRSNPALREKAEKLLPEGPENEWSHDNPLTLIHELQVHQIELEMQNDELSRAREEIEEVLAKYTDLYDFAPVGYLTFDRKGLISQLNLSAAQLLGSERSFLVNKPFSPFIQRELRDRFYLYLQGVLESAAKQTCELVLKKKDGASLDVQLEGIAVKADGQKAVRAVLTDITESKRLKDQLSAISITDELTGLYNRRGFITLADQQMKITERTKKNMVLFFTDLDKMKQINDKLGHHEGDKALIEVATILKRVFRESDILGRMGGDEFAILAIDATDETREVLVKRLHNYLDDYNRLEERSYILSLSIGIAQYNSEKRCSLDELMAQADTLMYEEKKNKQH